MASSGWQGQHDVQTNKYPKMYMDLAVDGISHEGTRLHVWGSIAINTRSGSISYNNASWWCTNGSGTINLRTGANYAGYNVWIDNVAVTATSYNFSAGFSAGSTASGSTSWTIYFDQSATAPSGISATWKSHTWNSVTMAVNLNSYGMPSGADGRYIEGAIMKSTATGYGSPYRWSIARNTNSATITVNNSSSENSNNPFGAIKGMTAYKIGAWATNTVMSTNVLNGTVYYTPPAPGSLSYTHENGTTIYNLSYALNSANNQSGYDAKEYVQQIEISSDGENWTATDFQLATTGVAKKSVNIDYGKTLYIRAHQVYQNQYSQYENITITNNDQEPIKVYTYGSVAQKSKEFKTIYASVNGKAKKLTKLYASVDGVAKLIYQAKD